MSTMIQIRRVPDKIHRQLKARAALAGMSMSEYILQELRKSLDRPPREELLDRISRLPDVKLSPSPAEVIREERDRRWS
jgi:plasmid stability protein